MRKRTAHAPAAFYKVSTASRAQRRGEARARRLGTASTVQASVRLPEVNTPDQIDALPPMRIRKLSDHEDLYPS